MDTKTTVFSKIFLNLLQDLSGYYSEYPEFAWYYNFLKTIGTTDIWNTLVDEYQKYSLPFKKQIQDRDEAFFIHKDFLDKLDYPDNNVVQEMERIRELYFLPKTTDEIKEKLWDYISKLTQLAHM